MDDESISMNQPEKTVKDIKKRYIKIQERYNSIEVSASNPQPGNDKRSRMLDGLSLTDDDLLEPKGEAKPREEPLLEAELVEILNQEITNLEITDLKSDANKMRQEIINLKASDQSKLEITIINNRQEIEELKSDAEIARNEIEHLNKKDQLRNELDIIDNRTEISELKTYAAKVRQEIQDLKSQ